MRDYHLNAAEDHPLSLLVLECSQNDRLKHMLELTGNELDIHLFFVNDTADLGDFLFHRGLYTDPFAAPRPDLILLDGSRLETPDGLGLVEQRLRFKHHNDLNSIPVAWMAPAAGQAEIESQVAGLGDLLLAKPLNRWEVYDCATVGTQLID